MASSTSFHSYRSNTYNQDSVDLMKLFSSNSFQFSLQFSSIFVSEPVLRRGVLIEKVFGDEQWRKKWCVHLKKGDSDYSQEIVLVLESRGAIILLIRQFSTAVKDYMLWDPAMTKKHPS